jgi:hypothetical protein
VKTVALGNQHESLPDTSHLNVLSLPAPDQTFLTGFVMANLSVKLYSMNFHKGNQISK